MVKKCWLLGVACLAAACVEARAQAPAAPVAQPDQTAPTPISANPEELALGNEGGGPSVPNMLGDQIGFYYQRRFSSFTSFSSSSSSSLLSRLGDPIVSRGGLKVADNESAMPTDRVFFDYNYYDRVFGAVNLDQEIIGFEKTFLGGDASFEMRVPFFQATGGGALDQSDVGDLTMILKYAFYRDRQNALAAGLAVTVPTGPSLPTVGTFTFNPVTGTFSMTPGTNVNDTIIQPWLGFLVSSGSWFAQGFSELMVPTIRNDVTAWFNDIQVGYWMMDGYNYGVVSNVAPVLELHLTSPLDHQVISTSQDVQVPTILDLTVGALVEFNHRSVLQIGIATPLSDPHPFDVEAIAQFNLRF